MNIDKLLQQAISAKHSLRTATKQQRHRALIALTQALEKDRSIILAANRMDVIQVRGQPDDAFVDRMVLNNQAFDAMLASVKSVAQLPDILGQTYNTQKQASGIT